MACSLLPVCWTQAPCAGELCCSATSKKRNAQRKGAVFSDRRATSLTKTATQQPQHKRSRRPIGNALPFLGEGRGLWKKHKYEKKRDYRGGNPPTQTSGTCISSALAESLSQALGFFLLSPASSFFPSYFQAALPEQHGALERALPPHWAQTSLFHAARCPLHLLTSLVLPFPFSATSPASDDTNEGREDGGKSCQQLTEKTKLEMAFVGGCEKLVGSIWEDFKRNPENRITAYTGDLWGWEK